MLCQIVEGPQFQNFTFNCCFLTCRRTSKNLTVTLNQKKTIDFKTILMPANSFNFSKLKIKRKPKTKLFILYLDKKPFWSF